MPQAPDPSTALDAELAADLAEREARGLYRRRRIVQPRPGARARVGGREYVNFSSNDYLGLACDPRLADGLREGLTEHGAGSGAAHLITGHSALHHELEQALAAFTGRPRALLFSTGYMANIGIAQALVGRKDAVLEDRLNHASLLDGALASRAKLIRYQHADADDLDRRLAAFREKQPDARGLVMSDSVFSMDGDIAPLAELATRCRAQGACLMVDEAHGLGVCGPQGRGAVTAAGLGPDEVPILMGTLGKAFGSFGAFVAGSETLIEHLIQHARSYVYTTATPAPLAASALRALAISREEDWRRDKLAELIQAFRAAAEAHRLPLMASDTPIQPLMLGEADRAVALSRALEAQGYLVQAIRPPTVPDGTARLRITLTAAHSLDDVRGLVTALAENMDHEMDTR
ncbi:8-amino-7-oxononanoate synthase [Natronospira bacteriovora]|uniref:8-amino-7-oxononanoate synthase n=1 Tax=Natronospira bacteriovora TaxID=3069753 RepID=A0ABU0W808_9GAMM|nr:8-amino-7-oxononanoate synthase [Natronospira sp. AB-CW4]MDQ2070177.1 8-amino-7-oxononanoate synthase [Natronospira sp. AB-CW4]